MSDTVVMEVVRVHDRVVELWSAEMPNGPFSENIGADHPCFALLALRSSANHDNALARALDGIDLTNEWLATNTTSYIESMELIDHVRIPAWSSAPEIAARIAEQPSIEAARRAALATAPRALYRVTVRDPAFIAHLKPGQIFGSTASSSLPHPRRSPTYARSKRPAIARLLEAKARVADSASIHLYRSWEGPRSSKSPWPHEDERAPEVRAFVSNRLRELACEIGIVQLVYFDKTASPDIKLGKLKFKKGQDTSVDFDSWKKGAAIAAALAPSPRGFLMNLYRSSLVRGADGVSRFALNYVDPTAIAWVDLEGEPLVRVGGVEGPDPSAPATHIDAYLESVAKQIEEDAARTGDAPVPGDAAPPRSEDFGPRAKAAMKAFKRRVKEPVVASAAGKLPAWLSALLPSVLREVIRDCATVKAAWSDEGAPPIANDLTTLGIVRLAKPGQHYFLVGEPCLSSPSQQYVEREHGVPWEGTTEREQLSVDGAFVTASAFYGGHRLFAHYDDTWFAMTHDGAHVLAAARDARCWTSDARSVPAVLDDALAWLERG